MTDSDLHVHNDDQNSVGGGGPSTLQAVRRSLSQTLLYQMSNTSPFGLGSRSNSPSMLLNSPLRNRTGFISNGPSLQSLVKSFINKVSRGTQTDCDDNFDVVSIASMTSGFSAFASDLTRSRLNMFLNDKSSVSNADDSEFVEELQKLRDQIDTRFGVDFTENEFNMMEIDATSVSRQESVKRSKVKQTTNQAVETENLETEESTTQTDDEEKPIGKSISIQIAPDMNENQTQTDKAKLCPHCCRVIASQSSFQFVENQLKPMIKCEILISPEDLKAPTKKLSLPLNGFEAASAKSATEEIATSQIVVEANVEEKIPEEASRIPEVGCVGTITSNGSVPKPVVEKPFVTNHVVHDLSSPVKIAQHTTTTASSTANGLVKNKRGKRNKGLKIVDDDDVGKSSVKPKCCSIS